MAEDALPVEEATVVDSPAPIHTLDVHMAPVLARMTGIGNVTENQLLGFYRALREAFLAHLENPVHTPPPVEEPAAEAQPEEARLFS